MAKSNLLLTSKTSFWQTQKKTIVIMAVFAVTALGVGGYLYWNDQQKAKQELAFKQVPPPDFVPESWVETYFGTKDINDSKAGGLNGDPDHDGLTNYQEYLYGTNPLKQDTDGDGYFDGTEVAYSSSPLGSGVQTTSDSLLTALKKSGIDVSQEALDKEFKPWLNADRKPQVAGADDIKLNITQDNSLASATAYNKAFLNLSSYMSLPDTKNIAGNLFSTATLAQVDDFIATATKMIDDLTALPVPSELAAMHKLYIQMYSGFLGMAKLAREDLKQGKTFDEGKFYPELHALMILEPELKQQKVLAFNKFQIPL